MLHSNFTPVNFLCFYYFLRALCAFVRHIFISLRFSHEGTKNTKKNIFLICDYRCPSVAKTRLVAAMPPYVLCASVRDFFLFLASLASLALKLFFLNSFNLRKSAKSADKTSSLSRRRHCEGGSYSVYISVHQWLKTLVNHHFRIESTLASSVILHA